MPSETLHFGLGFFDFGNNLRSDFSQKVEIDRWVLVDKQLYGLLRTIGNGVLEGWKVTAQNNLSVSISQGSGNINFTAARTNFSETIVNIPANTVSYVFVKIKERTTFTEDVEFVLSPAKNLNDPRFLILAEVTTGQSSVESVDNTIRQEIGFIELIKSAIQLHRHRGGPTNPSKIDLSSEVKGQLPPGRIADFDAEKITSGTLDLARMPLIDHQELDNVGLLTHAGLDTFVKTLEYSNKELFGEVANSVLLQLIISLKYIYDAPNSALYSSTRTIDENMSNELVVIPGISPDNYIDFDHSTAIIDTANKVVNGVAPLTGTSFYVTYDTDLAWKSAHSLENISVNDDRAFLAFDNSATRNVLTIEGFESATETGQDLSADGLELFRHETVILSNNAGVTATSTSTNVTQGFYAGEFRNQQAFRSQYVKEYSSPQDWSTYDSFVLHIKCLDAIHGPVKLYFIDDNNNKSIDYVLLDQNEITDNSTDGSNGFELRVVDLTEIVFRNKIKKIVIFTDDLTNPFKFFIDYINIQRAVQLPEQGLLKLRYSTRSQVVFSSIQWNSTELSGSQIKVRARSASGTVFLTRSDFTDYLGNSDLINLQGSDIEIEVYFYPDPDRIVSPILNSLKILVLSEAEVDGFKIDEQSEFERGSSENITIADDPSSISITSPIRVDSYYFTIGNGVNQISKETDANNNEFGHGELLVLGTNTPIAPNSVFKTIEDGLNKISQARLFEPRSVRRQPGRTFIVADTFNDRVLEMDESGNLLSGFGSINYEHTEKLFPIAAAIDSRTSILYIVWSKKVTFSNINVSKMTVQSTTGRISLVRDFDKIDGLTTDQLVGLDRTSQITPIHLSDQNAASIDSLGAKLFISISNDAFSSGLDLDSVFYKSLTTALGIPLFIGNFIYMDGIFCPTFADTNMNSGYMVANAKVAIKDFKFPTGVTEKISQTSNVSSIIEIDKNNEIVFGYDNILFSPFVPGRAEKLDESQILIAGFRGTLPSGDTETPSENQITFRSITGDKASRETQKNKLNKVFFPEASPFTGVVAVYDTKSKSTTFEYDSPEGLLAADVDIDPDDATYVVAETSFLTSGRVVKIDAAGNTAFSLSDGVYGIINDIEVQNDGSFVIST